jgi:hypothetical protein
MCPKGVNTVPGETLIDVSSPATWPTPLLDAVTELDARVARAEWPGDLEIGAEGTAAVWDALDGNRLLVRHFTRLLPHEAESIRDIGLELYSRALFDRRIEEANAHGYFDKGTAERLKAVTIPAAEAEQRGVRNFVCFTVGPIFEQEPDNVAELISKWGGEGLYFAAGAKPYLPLLQTLGKPAAVHVGLLLANESRPLSYCAIENLLLGQFRHLPDIFGDVFSRASVPANAIIEIELLG